MKKLILFLVIALFTTVSCVNCNKGESTYTIAGKVETDELDGKWIYLTPSYKDLQTTVLDSALIENGAFKMQGTAPAEPTVAIAIITEEDKTPTPHNANGYIVLEAGNINITIDEEFEMKMSGSPINDMINSSEAITEAYYEVVDSIKELAITRGEKLNLMNAAQKVRNDKLIEEITPFINTDPALIFMNAYYNLFTIEEITHLRSLLTTESLEKRTPTMERGEKKPIGTYVTDTKIPNLEGDSISLMSVIESYEYTLIDFWASWCGPCIRSIPEVKEIYSKYKSEDFEIIAVSLDREYSEWKNAVERYNFEWVNLSNLQAWKSPCVQEYSILYIPLKVLVDREGKVISRNPTAEELDIYLSK